MSKRKTISKGLYTTNYKVISMSKETGYVVVGLLDSPEQASEIKKIVNLSIIGFHMQDLNKGV